MKRVEMTNDRPHFKAASKAIAKSTKEFGNIDPGLAVLLLTYADQIDKLTIEGPVYKSTLLSINQMVEPPNPALVQLAIKLARDLDRNPDGRNASTAKEYRETIKAIATSEVRQKTIDDELDELINTK